MPSKKDLSVYARVRISLEVNAGQPWDGSATAEEIYKTAKESVIDSIQSITTSSEGEREAAGQRALKLLKGAKIFSEPVVSIIKIEER